MKRDEWTFDYTAAKLADAATKKRDHHTARLTWWKGKKAEVMRKVAESGIEVHDSVAADAYMTTRPTVSPQIRIDVTLQRDLTECQEKINRHRVLEEDYDGWLQVLGANPEARLSLDHEDYLFFFGK